MRSDKTSCPSLAAALKSGKAGATLFAAALLLALLNATSPIMTVPVTIVAKVSW